MEPLRSDGLGWSCLFAVLGIGMVRAEAQTHTKKGRKKVILCPSHRVVIPTFAFYCVQHCNIATFYSVVIGNLCTVGIWLPAPQLPETFSSRTLSILSSIVLGFLNPTSQQ